jgi:hypothetical protein
MSSETRNIDGPTAGNATCNGSGAAGRRAVLRAVIIHQRLRTLRWRRRLRLRSRLALPSSFDGSLCRQPVYHLLQLGDAACQIVDGLAFRVG